MTEKKTPEGPSYQEGQIDALILFVAEILAALPPQVAEEIIERTARNTLSNVDDNPAVLSLIEGYESTWLGVCARMRAEHAARILHARARHFALCSAG